MRHLDSGKAEASEVTIITTVWYRFTLIVLILGTLQVRTQTGMAQPQTNTASYDDAGYRTLDPTLQFFRQRSGRFEHGWGLQPGTIGAQWSDRDSGFVQRDKPELDSRRRAGLLHNQRLQHLPQHAERLYTIQQ